MKKFFLMIFTWWSGTTWGTIFYTWRKGKKIGEDEAGNIYYEGDGGKRWVQYAGQSDASAIEPGWHGWMHYRTDTPPTEETYQPKEWQKPHRQNATGTAQAYLPKGSMASPGKRDKVSGDYEAWSP